MQTTAFSGVWSYRALYNREDLDTPFDQLRFATAELHLREPSFGMLEGRLVGTGWGTWTEWSLAITGEAFFGMPHQIRLRGSNEIDGETWIYDYQGFLLPQWPHAEDPHAVLVGSVIRTMARPKGDARSGVNAAFYAVKQRAQEPEVYRPGGA